MSFLNVTDLSAGYGKKTVIENISFDIKEGEIAGLLGANGSGKTTLLKALCGILPHEGSCVLLGQPLEEMSPRQLAGLCSYIPQRSGISIDISALDVVLMGFHPRLGLLGRPSQKMRRKSCEMLKLVGLGGREGENYRHFSEGQKQLCLLARALAADGKLFFLDEPEGALDFCHRFRMMELLKNRVKKEGKAAVTSLHDPSLALNFCDRLLILSGGTLRFILNPKQDSPKKMQEKLSEVYGPVSLHRCRNQRGDEQLVMLREPQEGKETWKL